MRPLRRQVRCGLGHSIVWLVLIFLLPYHSNGNVGSGDGSWGTGDPDTGTAPAVTPTDQCVVSGDPHYRTFDGNMMHWQGQCKYVLVQVHTLAVTRDGLTDFSIYGKNIHDKTKLVTSLQYVELDVYNSVIRIAQNKIVTVDSVTQTLDVTLSNGVTIENHGNFVRIQTPFGVIVHFDGSSVARIQLPVAYRDCVYGLCQDFDNNPANDFLQCDQQDVQSDPNKYALIGTSCRAFDPSDLTCYEPELDENPCTANPVDTVVCNIIDDITGPFGVSQCNTAVEMADIVADYKTNCQYEVCGKSDLDPALVRCSTLLALAEECRAAGYQTDWRTTAGCVVSCPSSQTYQFHTSACVKTCADPTGDQNCQLKDTEGCRCPAGELQDGAGCYTGVGKCPCPSPDGQIGTPADTWYSSDCTTVYQCPVCTGTSCTAPFKLQSSASTCASPKVCGIPTGETLYKCYNPPVNGNWGAYGPWSDCATSTDGTRTRTRVCDNPAVAYGGNDCVGSATQTDTACTDPVNGGVSEWGVWSECTPPYYGGTQSRTRTCTNPAPQNGGSDCVEVLGEKQTCGCLFPFGTSQGDTQLALGDEDMSPFISTGLQPVYFYGNAHTDFQVSVNGFITFTPHFDRFTPSAFPLTDAEGSKVDMIAPFWSDIDLSVTSAGVNELFYQVYSRISSLTSLPANVQDVFSQATLLAQSKGDNTFYPSLIIVATWNNVVHYDAAINFNMRATFQVAYLQDTSTHRSYVVYNYGDNTWTTSFPNRIGFMSQNGFFFDHSASNRPLSYAMASQPDLQILSSSRGVCGSLVTLSSDAQFEVVLDNNPEYKCWVWAEEEAAAGISELQVPTILDCPCSEFTANSDSRYLFSGETVYNSAANCYTQAQPYNAQVCCYVLTADLSGPLILAKDYTFGSPVRYNPLFFRDLFIQEDQNPKTWCCRDSDNCPLYYQYRPQATCSNYVPCEVGASYGDPHFRTLDGLTYTFNGQGEFTAVESTDFTLQVRTVPTGVGNSLSGAATQYVATVFQAFAAQVKGSPVLQVELSADKSQMKITVNYGEKDHTVWFYSAATQADPANRINEGDGMFLNRDTKVSTPVLVATFPAVETKLRFEATSGVLSCTILMSDFMKGDKTRGLYGIFNDDPTDDLTPPTGPALPSVSPEKDIFYEFGRKWQISGPESLFTYPEGTDYANFVDDTFVPFFGLQGLFASTAAEAEAAQKCQNVVECMYDAAVTGNDQIGQDTRVIADTTNTIDVTIHNNAPVITCTLSGSDANQMKVTVGALFSASCTAKDADPGDTVVVTIKGLPEGAIYDMDTGAFTWMPKDRTSYPAVGVMATDSSGGQAVAVDVIVTLCDCSDHGTCTFETLQAGYSHTDRFQIARCTCNAGWEGDFCEKDLDGCAFNPCTFQLQTCTDVPAAEQTTSGQAYTCSQCPAGYTTNNNKCRDIDECAVTGSGTNPCDVTRSVCSNTVGSYKCTCKTGFLKITDTTCDDQDECELQLSDCWHICLNTLGSYDCICYPGFYLDSDGKTCVQFEVVLTSCATLGCDQLCGQQQGDSSAVQCYCKEGYALDGKTCSNINECLDAMTCGSNGQCTDATPGYTCTCNDGNMLDAASSGRLCVPCPEGTFGKECSQLCKCSASDTTCDATSGCAVCPSGWRGPACDVNIDECAEAASVADVCGTQATCTDLPGSFSCLCVQGYERLNDACIKIDPCKGVKCLNEGVCTAAAEGYTCVCRAGFAGDLCAEDIDECLSSPCKNGGICENLDSRYLCNCTGSAYGYTGAICDIEKKRILNFKPTLTNADSNVTDATLTIAVQSVLEGFVQTTYPNVFNRSKTYIYSGNPRTVLAPIVVLAKLLDTSLSIGTELLKYMQEREFKFGPYDMDPWTLYVDDILIPGPAFTDDVSLSYQSSLVITLQLVLNTPYSSSMESATTDEYKALEQMLRKQVGDIFWKEKFEEFFGLRNIRFSNDDVGVRAQFEAIFDNNNTPEDVATILKTGTEASGNKLGDFSVNLNTVDAAETDVQTFPVGFKILNFDYEADLADSTTEAYTTFRDGLRNTVDATFSVVHHTFFLWTEGYNFTNGSVDAAFTAVFLPSFRSADVITTKLREVIRPTNGFLVDFQLDEGAIYAGDRGTITDPASASAVLVGSVVGAVLGLVCLILIVCMVLVGIRRSRSKTRRTRREELEMTESSSDSGGIPGRGPAAGRGFFPYPRRMYWQSSQTMSQTQPSSFRDYDSDDLEDTFSRPPASGAVHLARTMEQAPQVNWGILRGFRFQNYATPKYGHDPSPYGYHTRPAPVHVTQPVQAFQPFQQVQSIPGPSAGPGEFMWMPSANNGIFRRAGMGMRNIYLPGDEEA